LSLPARLRERDQFLYRFYRQPHVDRQKIRSGNGDRNRLITDRVERQLLQPRIEVTATLPTRRV
jgi:hypothetical protein